MASIRQNSWKDALPDFRNLGVLARVLVLVNLLALAAAFASQPDWSRVPDTFVLGTVLLEPALLASLALLYAAAPLLRRLRCSPPPPTRASRRSRKSAWRGPWYSRRWAPRW
jgi:two-component system sensor histidine kinase AlgZ